MAVSSVADYAIGDVQGCFEPLKRLLERLCFDERVDRLWFVGDLINRGPQSLDVLRFIKSLPLSPRITLGNHDLHFLNSLFGDNPRQNHGDTLQAILSAPDREELGHWLRKQPILYYDAALDVVMCHAGIAPMWDFAEACARALELQQAIAGDDYSDFFNQMYGNDPSCWSPDLTGMTRLRVICNYFTRMRFCDANGHLMLTYKGTIPHAPAGLYPWYAVPNRCEIQADLVFGHWAALEGTCPHPRIHAIDTGCLWHGELTALRLQDKQRFSVPGLQ